MNTTKNSKAYGKAAAIGVINGILLSAVMVPLFLTGISPMPQPPSLAFAQTVLGTMVPMPVGLLFHLVYVTAWSMIFVLFLQPPTFIRALVLGLILWIVALVLFFPINGWGFLGLGVSPALIPAALLPHLLFSVFLWGLTRLIIVHRGA